MKPNEPSRTALIIARQGAAHQVLDHGSILYDPFAMKILREDEKEVLQFANGHPLASIGRLFTTARSRIAEDALSKAVERGIRQIVILGASHPIPADLEAVKVLAGAPAVLDLFMWLSYRCFVAKGKETIPLFGPCGLVSQIGSIEYARPRRFREKLDGWLGATRLLWPECPARISPDGMGLMVNRASAVLDEQRICS